MVNCRIIEEKSVDRYAEMKEAYLNGIRGERLREKFGIGRSAYKRLLREFREDGVTISHRGRVKVDSKPKYYYPATYGTYRYWVVRRTINWKVYNFGYFKSEAEAKAKVQELEANNWEGLL